MSRYALSISCIALTIMAAHEVAADAVYTLVVERQDTRVQGVATLIAEDTLLTSNALLSLGERWTLLRPGEDAEPLAGSIIGRDAASDLALLQVPGLTGTPVILAAGQPAAGRMVETLRSDGALSRGLVTRLVDDRLFEHSALYPAGQYGGAVVNNCRELIGLNQVPLQGRGRRIQAAAPQLPVLAASLEAILGLLEAGEVAVVRAEEPCASLEEQIAALESQTRQTAEERAQLETLRAELAERNEELEQAQAEMAEALEEKAGELAAAREELERLAEAREREQAEQRAEQERLRAALEAQAQRDRDTLAERESRLAEEQAARADQRRWLLILAGLTVLIVLLAAWLLWRRQRALREQRTQAARIQKELDKASVQFPDILLQGEFPEGGEARLKINGNALARAAGGQVLGRHPESADLVLNHPEVSRQHVRLSVSGNQLQVTDLGSFNGTAINGEPLSPQRPADLAHGDRLRIGTTELHMHLLGNEKR